MNINSKKKVRIAKGTTTGFFRMDWNTLEKQLKETGQLLEDQSLKVVDITEDGLYFSTKAEKGTL